MKQLGNKHERVIAKDYFKFGFAILTKRQFRNHSPGKRINVF